MGRVKEQANRIAQLEVELEILRAKLAHATERREYWFTAWQKAKDRQVGGQ